VAEVEGKSMERTGKTKFRQRYETEMIQKYDTHFYVGTMHGHPQVWIIVGLFYPPKSKENRSLFPRRLAVSVNRVLY